MQVFEKCDTINDEEYMLTKLIMSFPGIKGYVMTEHEDTTYNMVINAASFTAFIKQANKLNIPFTVEQVFTLTSEMEEYEITSILNNTALRESIAASPIRKQCVNTCQEFTYTIQQEEDEELIAKLYTKEQAEIYITDCKYDETTHAYHLTRHGEKHKASPGPISTAARHCTPQPPQKRRCLPNPATSRKTHLNH